MLSDGPESIRGTPVLNKNNKKDRRRKGWDSDRKVCTRKLIVFPLMSSFGLETKIQ